MNNSKLTKKWKKINLFQVFLIIAIALILSNTQNLLARPTETKNEFRQNCNFCHFSNSSSRGLPVSNENTKGDDFSSLKECEFKNKVHSSKLCLSCHDGTIAPDPGINMTEGEKINVGFDPKKNHPVSVDYMTAYSKKGSKKLHHPSTIAPLKLCDGKVECNTCHDTHQSFRLRVSISRSELCLRCHNK